MASSSRSGFGLIAMVMMLAFFAQPASAAPCTVDNGVCNNTIALGCTVGSPISDNGQTACAQTRTWVCQGANGGTNSGTCSRSNGACPVGACNNSVALGCSVGTPISDNGQTGCGTTRTWVCNAAGGNSGACSYDNGVCSGPPASCSVEYVNRQCTGTIVISVPRNDRFEDVYPATTITGRPGSEYECALFCKQFAGVTCVSAMEHSKDRMSGGDCDNDDSYKCDCYSGAPKLFDVPNEYTGSNSCGGIYDSWTAYTCDAATPSGDCPAITNMLWTGYPTLGHAGSAYGTNKRRANVPALSNGQTYNLDACTEPTGDYQGTATVQCVDGYVKFLSWNIVNAPCAGF